MADCYANPSGKTHFHSVISSKGHLYTVCYEQPRCPGNAEPCGYCDRGRRVEDPDLLCAQCALDLEATEDVDG